MTKLPKDIEKALDNLDYKGLAEAYHKMQMDWNAHNWRYFIEEVRERQKKEIIEKIFCSCRGRVGEASMPGYIGLCPTCRRLIDDQAIKTIKGI